MIPTYGCTDKPILISEDELNHLEKKTNDNVELTSEEFIKYYHNKKFFGEK